MNIQLYCFKYSDDDIRHDNKTIQNFKRFSVCFRCHNQSRYNSGCDARHQ